MSIWIWVTSLVERVMRLAVEKRPISSMEKDCTLENSRPLRVAPRVAAMRAAQMAVTTEAARLPREHSSIIPPAERISPMVLPAVWTRVVISAI